MRKYTDIIALQCKHCGDRKTLKCNSANMIAYSFFMREYNA